VGRVSQDLGKGSNVGLMYTDEEFGGGWNRIGGADFTWRMNNHWTTLGQMVESSTMQSNPQSTAAVFPAGYHAGPAADVQVTRNGHAFNMFNEYQDISSGFTTLVGFCRLRIFAATISTRRTSGFRSIKRFRASGWRRIRM